MADFERYFRMLSECNQILLRADDEQVLTQNICDTITKTGKFDSAFMGLVKSNRLELASVSGELKEYKDRILIDTQNEKYSSGASGRALKDGETHVYNDVSGEKDYDAYRDIIEKTSLRSNMAVPIKLDGKIIGTLGIYSKKANIFTEVEQKLFEDLVEDLAYGISSIRARKRIELLNGMLQRIRLANQRIAKEDNVDSLLDGFCKDLLDEKLYYGIAIDHHGKIYCAGECGELIGEAIKSKKLKLDDCSEDFRIINYKCEIHPDSMHGCIKVKSGDTVYANLFVCAKKDIFNDPEQVDLLRELAVDLGVGIDRILNRSDALRLGRIFENISEGINILDPKTMKFKFVNLTVLNRLGYTLDEIKKMTLEDTIELTPGELLMVSEFFEQNKKAYFEFETISKRKDGTVYPVRMTAFYDDDPTDPSYVAITTDLSGIKSLELKLSSLADDLISSLSNLVEMKDPYTAGHQKRVSALAVEMAKEMNLESSEIESIRIAGLLHDIGKMSVPIEILTKPSKLKETEFELIKEHSEEGYKILKDITNFQYIAMIVRQHHERMNGTGYPLGIKGKDITIGGKVIGVADVVEAMVSHRPYRPALGLDAALDEIKKNAGILYDENVVKACEKVFQRGWYFDTQSQKA